MVSLCFMYRLTLILADSPRRTHQRMIKKAGLHKNARGSTTGVKLLILLVESGVVYCGIFVGTRFFRYGVHIDGSL